MSYDGIFDRRVIALHGVAERVNRLEVDRLDSRIRKLEETEKERPLTFDEMAELIFICLKVLTIK